MHVGRRAAERQRKSCRSAKRVSPHPPDAGGAKRGATSLPGSRTEASQTTLFSRASTQVLYLSLSVSPRWTVWFYLSLFGCNIWVWSFFFSQPHRRICTAHSACQLGNSEPTCLRVCKLQIYLAHKKPLPPVGPCSSSVLKDLW